MTLEPKTRLAHYEIHSPIGKGGMGEVYLALDKSTHNRKVAIKVLNAGIAPDPECVRRFEQEARTVSALNHPNILTIYESGQVDSTQFIAMEYVDGVTLREYLNGAALPVEPGAPVGARRIKLHEVLGIIIQIAAALDAAHEAKVVHRDIKPENIMIRRRDAIVKVIDFGLAKLVERPAVTETGTTAPMFTQLDAVMGTYAYMSPEQTVKSHDVDSRSDIWSLGVVLYEMITGRVPFEGRDKHRQVIAIQESDPAPLTLYAQRIPERLEEIVARTLAKSPDERYQSAKDLLIDLRNLSRRLDLDAEMDRAQPPEQHTRGDNGRNQSAPAPAAESGRAADQSGRLTVYRIVQGIKRNKLAAALTCIAVSAVAIGIYFGTRQQTVQKKSSSSPTLVEPTKLLLTDSGKVTRACISPKGKFVAYVLSDAGKQSLMLMNRENQSKPISLVPPTEENYWGLTFSPDTNYVYYLTRKRGKAVGNLYRVAVSEGTPEHLIEDVDSIVTFSPDGRKMAFVRWHNDGETDLWTANEIGKDLQLRATSRSVVFNGVPAWSPDGQLVACPIWDKKARHETVTGIRVSDGERVDFTQEHWNDVGQLAWVSNDRLLIIAGEEKYGKQIWYLSYPDGQAQQLTSGPDDYTDLSLTKDSNALITVQSRKQSNVYVAPAGNPDSAKNLTNGTGVAGNYVTWTRDGRIIYDSQINNNIDLWVMNPDGTHQQRLTSDSDSYKDFFPSASSAGPDVVFISNRSGTDHVWRMNDDGSNPIQLSFGETSEKNPVLTPDGSWVICEIEGIGGLWKLPIDGGTPPQRLISDWAFRPAVDPKGQRIAYWLFAGPEGSTAREVFLEIMAFPDGIPITRPIKMFPSTDFDVNLQWSADSKNILYVDKRNGVSNIWSKSINDDEPQQKTQFKTGNIFSFAYSPDESQLALTKGSIAGEVMLMTNLKR